MLMQDKKLLITENFLSLRKRARGIWERNTANELVYRQVFFTKPLESIIIHWIGPYPHHTPAGLRDWWEKGNDDGGVQSSTHFIVKDDFVLQTLPLNEPGWHSSDGRNYIGIGIEVIPMNAAGEFSQASINTLKLLIQHIRKETGRNMKLERHFDNGVKKDCPRYYTNITSMVGVEGRVSNPDGGDQRWEMLKAHLNDEQYTEKMRELPKVIGNIPPDGVKIVESDRNARIGDYWPNYNEKENTIRYMQLTASGWKFI